MEKYPICDELYEEPSKHCAPLAIVKDVVTDAGRLPQFAQPSDKWPNGTITFVTTGGNTYGITCWHIIESLQSRLNETGDPYRHSLRTMLNGFYVVENRFVRPASELCQPPLDVAIRELHPKLPSQLGKEPIDLDNAPVPPAQIRFACAVGFPTDLKHRHEEGPVGYRVSMPHSLVLAELNEFPTQRFQLFSELDEPPSDRNFSGMSGGPIYWSTEHQYGLLGIVRASLLHPKSEVGERVIAVSGELATPKAVKAWIERL